MPFGPQLAVIWFVWTPVGFPGVGVLAKVGTEPKAVKAESPPVLSALTSTKYRVFGRRPLKGAKRLFVLMVLFPAKLFVLGDGAVERIAL